jgi:RNA polymerase sigma-70 factor (ECF subfamily)
MTMVHQLTARGTTMLTKPKEIAGAARALHSTRTAPSSRARASGPQSSSDEVLMERIARGDRLAMEVFYARHHIRVFRFVQRLIQDQSAAEDLISEVFLEVWRHADRFEGRSTVSTWVLGIARFKALSTLRRRPVESWDEQTAKAIEDPADNPAIALEKKDTSMVIRRCLTALPPRHREIIDLAYYHGKSLDEVAEIVGIPKNTVKTRMLRARMRLAGLLRGAGIERA